MKVKFYSMVNPKMESLIPDLREIVESYMSPYHEICRQNRECQKRLKNIDSYVDENCYNLSFLKQLIDAEQYHELLHDCLLAGDTDLYKEIEKICIFFEGTRPTLEEKKRKKTFQKVLWSVVMSNKLCGCVSLLKQYKLEPARPEKISLDMLEAFAENYHRKSSYMNAFLSKKQYQAAQSYLISSTETPLGDGLMTNNEILECLRNINKVLKKHSIERK